jgi:hypothetical protein
MQGVGSSSVTVVVAPSRCSSSTNDEVTAPYRHDTKFAVPLVGKRLKSCEKRKRKERRRVGES